MDKNLECGALSCEPGTAKDCMLGVLEDDGFTVYPTAGNFGRAADTIAAICGAVLGGMYGCRTIPARWAEKAR